MSALLDLVADLLIRQEFRKVETRYLSGERKTHAVGRQKAHFGDAPPVSRVPVSSSWHPISVFRNNRRHRSGRWPPDSPRMREPHLRPRTTPPLYLIYMFSYQLLSDYTYPRKKQGVTGRTALGTDDPVAERGPSHPIRYKLEQLLGPHEPAFRKEER